MCGEGQAKPKLYTSAVIIAEVNHGTDITMGGQTREADFAPPCSLDWRFTTISPFAKNARGAFDSLTSCIYGLQSLISKGQSSHYEFSGQQLMIRYPSVVLSRFIRLDCSHHTRSDVIQLVPIGKMLHQNINAELLKSDARINPLTNSITQQNPSPRNA